MVAQQSSQPQRQPRADGPFLTAALAYAARGWRVFPLLPNQKTPLIPKSRGGHGLLDATTESAQIRSWWRQQPRANIGLATGGGLIVLDVDLYKGADIGEWRLPPTLTAVSARGGQHLLYSYADPLPCIAEGRLAPHVCVKATGGYIVAAPSTFQGKPYQWQDVHQPISPLPERIAEIIRASARLGHAGDQEHQRQERQRGATMPSADDAQRWLDWAMQKTCDGLGDRVGLLLAQQLIVNNVADVEGTLTRYAAQATINPSYPFTSRDVGRWISSASESEIVQRGEPARSQRAQHSAPAVTDRPRREQKASESAKSEPIPDEFVTEEADAVTEEPEPEDAQGEPEDGPATNEHRTDMGNARRFVARFGRDARYVTLWKQWLLWDGKRWKPDDSDAAFRLAKETVRGIYAEASRCEEEDERRELVKWAMKSEADSRIRAMLAQAQSEPEIAITPSVLDAHPWLLNVQNGTLDLRTAALRPHRREDYLTQIAPEPYDPAARFAPWDAFLRTVTGGDEETSAFLQRAVGYTLTGDTGENKLFFTHGPTHTGKSTFLEAIKATLGEYAKTADFETFLAKKSNGGPRDDIADLAGSRMVCSSEVDEGKRLAQGLVKTLTGGEKVKARHLYAKSFEFLPQFKLWLAANDAPQVNASDGAMWRRIVRIPFEHEPAKKDPNVKLTLRNPAVAGPAILAWAVQGCLAWQRDGLGVPPAIEEATESYRASMDPLKEFLDDRCILGANYVVTVAALWEAYLAWVTETHERRPLSSRQFKTHIEGQSCNREVFCNQTVRKVHGVATRCWSGIALLSSIGEGEKVTVTELFP